MNNYSLMGVRIDLVTLEQSINLIQEWIKSQRQYRVSTPNFEFLIEAEANPEFKKILNSFELNIPDSSHFNWLAHQFDSHPPDFPVTTGADLSAELLRLAPKYGWRISVYGATDLVHQALKVHYPAVQWGFCETGGKVSFTGETNQSLPQIKSDIVLVGLGQVKQESWINRYWQQIPGTVFIGVGGSLDYLSGLVPRAPRWIRQLGFEWLYRLIKQPWRIKRQIKIAKLVLLLRLSRRQPI